ncbi:MAG TPA: restriction endonuclease [Asanoa sp.]|nr:restriction endonuclease [Asanoa sp.]
MAAGAVALGAVAAAVHLAHEHRAALVVAGTAFVVVGVRFAARNRRRLPSAAAMTDRQLAVRVAALLRAAGWRQVTVTAAMGQLGTDVVGVGVDGRRWVTRCHREPARLDPSDVHRFADTVRQLRRGNATMLVTAGTVPSPVRNAALRAGVTLVDFDGLAGWAAHLPLRQRGPSAKTVRGPRRRASR